MAVYYISDLHFGHKNILAYDDREFSDIETHDRALMEIWNSTVDPDDEVWLLGDISWYNPLRTIEIFSRLNGTKYLCAGNHDKRILKNKNVRDLFAEITDYKEIRLTDRIGVVLCHYPIPCFNHHFHGWIHLYGHVHASFEWNMMKQVQYQMTELYDADCRMYNIGCMMPGMDYTPRTLNEILRIYEGGEGSIEPDSLRIRATPHGEYTPA